MANETIRQRTHEGVDRIMDKAQSMGDKAQSIRDSGKEEIARLKEKAARMKENADSYIRENPEKSVLIAAGIGAVAGAMLAAAMMRKKH